MKKHKHHKQKTSNNLRRRHAYSLASGFPLDPESAEFDLGVESPSMDTSMLQPTRTPEVGRSKEGNSESPAA